MTMQPQQSPTEAPEDTLLAFLRGTYLDAKRLPDGSIACLMPLMYTTAIGLDCDRWGYGKRFCFEDAALAVERYKALQSADDVPEGFIARR